ncbi:MAG: hypothetical protein MjAS7_2001 [Metallosphaera javensis (ex Sakai et al. 2022)]|nr:MAG: hypothetical protein MjAS7_2001 [Metallosphaera javensis (ex Sakai et al. 2022)]
MLNSGVSNPQRISTNFMSHSVSAFTGIMCFKPSKDLYKQNLSVFSSQSHHVVSNPQRISTNR